MKIGRNEPCPCGSGKKYKKCCLLKRHIEQPVTRNDKYEVADDDLALEMTYAMRNMHMYFLKRKPHIKEYMKIRRLHGEILSSMVHYHDSGRFEQKIDENYIPHGEKRPVNKERVLILQDAHFDLSSNIGMQAFADS